ncbi:MAG TPA: YggS family pyridoxal phosphate-dependent enzyme [Polyangia bacterium]|nr:YggS family pyridoxal phosphate-dependent enzyme [Polyangia bacterium]
MTRAEQIAANLARVRDRIAVAARTAGRPPEAIRLLAVSKKMPADDVRAAMAAGQRAFGENYAQELRDKAALLAADPTLPAPPEWHFIGPLQGNKVKYIAGKTALVHSVDSPALLDAIEARGAPQACLVQVNVAGEASKKGVAPADLPALLDRFAAAKNVRCQGLMLIPPRGDARPHFAALRALRDREATVARPNVDLRDLSMGMTDDLEVAIAEGATIVRVGTAIFGPRPHTSNT